jgi:hypothetical protein
VRKARSKGVAEVCHRGFYSLVYSLVCTLEPPHNELISRSFGTLLPRGCEESKTGMHYTGIEITIVDLRLRRTLLCPPRFIRAMIGMPRRCHGHVKDVRRAIRRCARRVRLSFPKVPSFCSLRSPRRTTHINNVVRGKKDVVAHLHLVNSQLTPWALAQASARGSAQLRTCIRLSVS